MKSRAFLLAAVGCVALWAAAASAVQICPDCLHFIHTWPADGAPCSAGQTLQACIDGARSGDIVQIATDRPIAESISIGQSLTLQAAPGFHPLFAGPGSHAMLVNPPSTGNNSIAIEGLILEHGGITISQNSTGTLAIEIRGNTITLDKTFQPITLAGDGSGAVTFDIADNNLAVAASSGEYPAGITIGASSAIGRIANNTIVMESVEGGTPTDAIHVDGQSSLSLDVIANRISGTGYANGISVTEDTAGGSTTARLLDNLVTGAGGRALVLASQAGTLSASVMGNTVVGSGTGISIQSGTATVENNAIVGSDMFGLFENPNSVSDRNNLYFRNAVDVSEPNSTLAPGPGSVLADPLFLDPSHGNYHVKLGSPAVDAGDDGAVPSDLTTDLDGNPRTQGLHVDLGALEAPAPSALGTPRAFTGELQIEIGGAQLFPTVYGHGNAVLSTSVAPPAFTLPASAFVASTDFASTQTASELVRQVVSLAGHNAAGAFDAQARTMPFSGLLKLKRLGGALTMIGPHVFTFFDVHGTAAAGIDAGYIGAPGAATVHFPYLLSVFKQTQPFSIGHLTGVRTFTGTAKLTGQSFQITEDSRTAAGGGHIQLVAPFSFTASPISTWSPSSSVTLALDFAPEPDPLAVGAITIAVLCAVGVAKRRDA